jgi:peptide/nickel transport system permease protein
MTTTPPVSRPPFGPNGGTATAAAGGVAPAALVEPVDAAPAVEVAGTRKLGLIGWLSLSWMTVLLLAVIFAPALPLDDPDESFLEIVRQGPTQPGHILGGDGNGRDMLARVIYGARTSLLISVSAVLIAFVVGGVLGLIAGYARGKADTFLSTAFNVLLSIPSLVLVLSFVAVFASSDQETSNARLTTVLVLAIALVSMPLIARITRASTMAWSEREFVRAAEVLGARHTRIVFREVLPNVLPAMASIALLGIGLAIVAEGGLALLGASVVEVPSWGNMIALGRPDLARAPHIVAIPSIAIFLTILSLNVLGDVVRARFDVRESVL